MGPEGLGNVETSSSLKSARFGVSKKRESRDGVVFPSKSGGWSRVGSYDGGVVSGVGSQSEKESSGQGRKGINENAQ